MVLWDILLTYCSVIALMQIAVVLAGTQNQGFLKMQGFQYTNWRF